MYICDFFCNFAAQLTRVIMMEIIKYCIPAICVFLATWLVMHKFYQSETEKRMWELKRLSQKEISPLRMRAYERLVLLLERTMPERMLVDINIAEMTLVQLQTHLMRVVRQEYDHNLSQQIYISDEVWAMVENAQIQMIAFINSIAQQMPVDSTAMDYAKTLITAYRNNGDTPNDLALQALRNEAKSLL